MKMKRILLSFSLLVGATLMHAQLTLDECRRQAQANYPLVRQYGLIEKAREYDLSNAGKGYLPQFSLSGKATYQSEITRLPVEIPGIDVKTAPKDQYQVMLEVQQTLWDGGDIRSRKRLTRAASDVEMEKQNVDMYALNDRVNQLFFGILLLDEQLKQNQLLLDDLGRTHKQVSDYIANGIASQSDLDAVSVEQLNTKQRRVELETSRRAYLNMLSAFIGKEVSSETSLVKPPLEETGAVEGGLNNRPELRWFDAQGEQLRVQEATLNTRLMPRFGLFVQGAYGNPGLNMLKDEFDTYYIAGVRMSWNFGSLYTLKNDRRRIDNNRRRIESSRDVFLFNTRLEATRQDANVISMRRQMADDNEIIRLRENIRRAAEAKVENGTLTVTDMLREITNENLARQTKALHEVQLLMNIWQLKYTLNQ
ncbi:TolC family protein [Bacteroides sp. GD17]|jgi:outer membrane protein TolC|uniref:TolC family protein n=1 Tax=Bacteroides sp. GD17 TaxID=3139826 RepID=UPI0025E51CA5|nr:TolC family protein [uncultured Bacteroides sp.]